MNIRAWVDPRIKQLTAEKVRAYMLCHGWQSQPFPGPELLVFGGLQDDDGEPIVQIVPSSERMSDFRVRTEELIGALSVIEDRPAVEILVEMLNQPSSDGLTAPTTNGAPAQVGRPSAS